MMHRLRVLHGIVENGRERKDEDMARRQIDEANAIEAFIRLDSLVMRDLT